MKTPAEYYASWYARNIEKARAMKAANMRKYRAENPEKHRSQSRNAKAVLRRRLLEMYGFTCSLCGFSDTRWHDLRHSTASMLINSGVSLYVVGQILGHSSTQTTSRYAHLYDQTLVDAMAKLDPQPTGIPPKRRLQRVK